MCNAAVFVGFVGNPDGATVGAGQPFKEVWDIRNVGTCTWDRRYRLVFNAGEHMSGPNWVLFPSDVAPGAHVFLGVSLYASKKAGTHTGYWILQAPDGTQFGMEGRGDKPLHVTIVVR